MTQVGQPFAPQAATDPDRERLGDVAVGVVGCGLHSTTAILPSLRHAGVRLVAVCDLDAGRAESAGRRFGAEHAYRSLDDLLARPDLDAVLIVGPPELHVSAGIAAVRAGRHAFVEKPPGTSLADATRLQQAAHAANRQVMVGFMKRRAGAYRLAHQLMAQPEFGRPTSVDITYAHWPVPDLRTHLVDMSIHALDMVRWLLGDPVAVSAYKRAIGGNHVLALMFEHTGAAVSRLDLSGFQPGVQERLVITGEGAVIRVDNLVHVTYTRQADAPAEQTNGRLTSTWEPEFSLPDRENDMQVLQGYAPELIAFADAIREGGAVHPSIDDGVAAMRLIEAILDAPDGLSVTRLDGGG